MPLRMIAVGDCITSRALAPTAQTDAAFAATVDLLRGADAVYGNLETSIVDVRDTAASPAGGRDDWSVVAPPIVADDLRDIGFAMFGRANNHGSDWNIEGLRETGRWLDRAGLVHAGAGETASAAYAPRYVDTPNGRVGLVSATTTPANDLSAALDPRGETPSRPGLNVIPVRYTVAIPKASYGVFRQLQEAMYFADTRWMSGADDVELFFTRFVEADVEEPSVTIGIDPEGASPSLRSIRQASQHADGVIFAVHAHHHDRNPAEPPPALRTLAHEAIEAGATAVIISGPHTLGPIELYKGKPIVYGPGNFIWSDIQEPLAHHMWHRSGSVVAGLPHADPTDHELMAALNADAFDDPGVFQAIAVEVQLGEDGRVRTLLHPMDLGYGLPVTRSGVPRSASPQAGREITRKISKMSESLGAAVRYEDGAGIVELA